jgi:hypothetical protein
MTGYDAVMTSIFIRGLIGVAAVTASVAIAGCSAPEQQSLGEFVRNGEPTQPSSTNWRPLMCCVGGTLDQPLPKISGS